MKLLLRIALYLFLATTSLAAADNDRSETLRVCNWADYLDERIIGEFETWYAWQTGQKVCVEYVTFNTPEDIVSRIETRHDDYDVFCPTDYLVEYMLSHKLLLKLDTTFSQTNTPNWLGLTSPFIDDNLQQMGRDLKVRVKDYAVGYLWGVTGVLLNKKYVQPDDVSSWGFLFDNKFRQKVVIKDSYTDVCFALMNYAYREQLANGQMTLRMLASALTNENIQLIGNMLEQMKPQIGAWESSDGPVDMGSNWASVTWSGDALLSMTNAKPGTDLSFVVPQEGSDYWIDCWVIPAYARNVKAANYWIDFMCKPQNALRCMQATGFASAIASPYMLEGAQEWPTDSAVNVSYFFGPGHEAVAVNSIMYPDSSVIARCGMVRNNGGRQIMLQESWERLKARRYSSGTTLPAIVAVAVIAVVLCYLLRRKLAVLRSLNKTRR